MYVDNATVAVLGLIGLVSLLNWGFILISDITNINNGSSLQKTTDVAYSTTDVEDVTFTSSVSEQKQRCEALGRQKIQDETNAAEREALRRQQIQAKVDAAEHEARRQRILDEANAAAAAAAAVADNNPLDKFDHWLINIGKDKRGKNTKVPTLWINTIVFCVAHLAEELTSFRPGDCGIHEFPTQSGVTSASIVEYVRDAKKGWLDDEYDPKISKSGPTACPGIGNATAKALAKVGIRTTRQLLEKFNTFSYCSIKSKYR